MRLHKIGSTVMLGLALVVGLTVLAPRAAQAGDTKKAVIAVAAGVLLYELLKGDDRDDRGGCSCEHRDRGYYQERYRAPQRCPVHTQQQGYYYPQSDRGDFRDDKKYQGGYYPQYDGGKGYGEKQRGNGYYRNGRGSGGCDGRPQGSGYYR